jgi:hypothetical protein
MEGEQSALDGNRRPGGIDCTKDWVPQIRYPDSLLKAFSAHDAEPMRL